MPKSNYKGIKKSRKNTSGRPSTAKREAEKRAAEAKRKKAGKAPASKSKKKRIAKGFPFRRSQLNPQAPKQLPETPETRKGMTLRKLLRGTPRLMVNNAGDVDVLTLVKTSTRSGMPALQAVTLTQDPWRPNKVKRPHDTFIIGLDKSADGSPDTEKPVNKHTKVLVSCSCENYVYTWEYANATVGASRIVYGNGEPPNMTNPQLAYGLCKHLVAMALAAIKSNK